MTKTTKIKDKIAKSTASSDKTTKGFSEFERAAMKERALELMTEQTDGESALLAKIEAMHGVDRTMAEQLHILIKANAPELTPKTWYGMPAYANKDGKVVCFFQSAEKFKARYATLGFNDIAMLDEGNMWPTAFALKKLTDTEEAKIVTLIKNAVRIIQ